MERAIQIFAAVNFLIIGLSHVFQHRAWAEFFVRLHALGRPGAFANGFLSLITGSLIVAFHDVWEFPAMILTILGWSFVLKAAIVFIQPDWGVRSMTGVDLENSRRLIVAGVIMVILAAALAYGAWR